MTLLIAMFGGCMMSGTTAEGAEGEETTKSPLGNYTYIIMFVLLIVVFYFFLIRPENKKKKKLAEMRNELSVGDEITTIGGLTGKICSIKDDLITFETGEAGRKSVADLVASCGARVYPVGRLDMASEGLLLMTNDGDVTNKLTHPRYGMTKVYHVRVEGEDPFGACSEMGRGMTVEGVTYSPAKASVLEREGSRALLEVTVTEGKNREVRRMCEACRLSVRRLVRVEEGKLSLGKLASGKWRYLTADEIEYLKSL